jgi:hypothetical protein
LCDCVEALFRTDVLLVCVKALFGTE